MQMNYIQYFLIVQIYLQSFYKNNKKNEYQLNIFFPYKNE